MLIIIMLIIPDKPIPAIIKSEEKRATTKASNCTEKSGASPGSTAIELLFVVAVFKRSRGFELSLVKAI